MAGLYFHTPFRTKDRPFDEAFVVPTPQPDYEGLARAIKCELSDHLIPYADTFPIKSVYVGGGRPSMMPLAYLKPLVKHTMAVFNIDPSAEVTIELCPGDASTEYLEGLREAGFNRLSVTMLSFFEEDLGILSAPHSEYGGREALKRAREIGFDNISIDLVFGWPELPMQRWKRSIHEAVDLQIEHISLQEWPAPPADEQGVMQRTKQYRYALNHLESNGYTAYEISHFARPSYASVHNATYWNHDSFLGIGPAAHSFWWPPAANFPQRWANVADLDEYLDVIKRGGRPLSFQHCVDQITLAQEYLALRLRTREGLDLNRYHERYGIDLRATHSELLDRLSEHRLVHPLDDNILRLTHDGWLVSDSIVHRLLPDSS